MATVTSTPTVWNYSYDYDYRDELCHRTDGTNIKGYFTAAYFILVVIISLLGNILVVVILLKYENPRHLTNTLILNLAVSDLFFTAGLPFWAYYHIYGWTLGETTCKMVNFIFYVGFYSGSILLILMTIHRYVAVMNPLSDIVSTKGFWSAMVSLMIWVLSLGLAIPAFIFYEVQDGLYCTMGRNAWTLFGIYQQNFLFVATAAVFLLCYSQIICRLLRPTPQRRKVKTLKVIFTLVVVFFLSWGPYNIVLLLQSFYYLPKDAVASKEVANTCETMMQQDNAFFVCHLFAFSHCCLNPVFYVFVGVKFNNHLKKMLKSCGHGNHRIRSRQSRLTVTSLTSGDDFSLYTKH